MIAPSRARLLPRTLLRARVLALAMSASARPTPPRASRTITKTDEPIIVSLQALTRSQSDVASLAQGIVHWPPPPEALEMAAKAAADPASAAYGAAEGLPALREALRDKLAAVNGFRNSDVMVTAGREPCEAIRRVWASFPRRVVSLVSRVSTAIPRQASKGAMPRQTPLPTQAATKLSRTRRSRF